MSARGTRSPSPIPTAGASATSPARPAQTGLFLIGWDGADWELLDGLMEAGRMPNLRRLVGEGRTANLEVFTTTVSPMVWTTISTGAEPPDHGVLDFFELEQGSGREIPVSAASQRLPAFWDIASARGRTVGVVGYWASFPAEEVRGFVVTDRVCSPLADPDEGQLSSAVYPPAEAAGLRALLNAHAMPSDAVLAGFGDFTRDELTSSRVTMLRRLLRSTEVSEAAAEDLYDRYRPEALVLYSLGTDEVAHLFGNETPPRLACVFPDSFTRLSGVVDRYYALMDGLLGRWIARAERDGRTILLVSDHGFRWGKRRSCTVNRVERTNSTLQHRPIGIAAAWGPRVVPSGKRATISVFDLAPTASALLGLPVDRRAPGRALVDWFRGVRAPAREALWEREKRARRLPAVTPRADEYAERLRNLGYLGGAGAPRTGTGHAGVEGRTAGGWINLGSYWDGRGQHQRAVEAYEEALALWPANETARINLVGSLLKIGRSSEAVAAARALLDHTGEAQAWAIYEVAARLEAANLIRDEEALLQEAARRLPNAEPVAVSLAGLDLGRGRCREALDRITPFLGGSQIADTLNIAGLSLACLSRHDEARRMLVRSLLLVPDQPHIRQALNRLAPS